MTIQMHDISSRNSPPAVVVGLSVTGLGTVRSLARSGIQVYGVDSNFDQPSARSRYCTKVYCSDINREDNLIDTLVGISRKLNTRPVLFLSTDISVLIASENREFLRGYYAFNLPSQFAISTFMDKALFADFAVKNGFQIPRTFVAHNYNDIKFISNKILYPHVFKPSFRNPKWDNATPVKVFKVHSGEELISIYQKNSHLAKKFLIQELIPGPDSEIYFCLLWYNSASQPIASFTGRKVIQWPPHTGSTCVAKSCNEDTILRESIRLFDAVNYKGIGSVEFKKDLRDGIFKIVEPTVGRADLQSAIAYHSDINVPLLEYCDCVSLKLPELTPLKRKVCWINEENLFWLLGSRQIRKSLASCLPLLRNRKYYAFFNPADILPICHLFRHITKTIFNKSLGL